MFPSDRLKVTAQKNLTVIFPNRELLVREQVGVTSYLELRRKTQWSDKTSFCRKIYHTHVLLVQVTYYLNMLKKNSTLESMKNIFQFIDQNQ